MNIAGNMEWCTDLDNMTCRNVKNDVVVSFEKKGNQLLGKIADLPNDIFWEWANIKNWDIIVKKTIAEAEKVFLREYAENKACA